MPTALASHLEDARRRTLAMINDLEDQQLMVPELPTVNPLLWEIGHVAWFQEFWILRTLRQQPMLLEDADGFYDSSAVAHARRWRLPLPGRSATLRYARNVLDLVLKGLHDADTQVGLEGRERQLHFLVLFHEDMHGEALAMTRQTLGYPAPGLQDGRQSTVVPGEPEPVMATDDVHFPAVRLMQGSPAAAAFAFDNEMQQHEVEVATFSMARRPVTQGEFLAFVEDGGYRRPELWSTAGWEWRQGSDVGQPLYWKRDGKIWGRRHFDHLLPLEVHLPMFHVAAHEADAYCCWAGRRLPTESEWETAAHHGQEQAILDGNSPSAAPVASGSRRGTPQGVQDLMGNIWEWTATTLGPYPGFRPGVYADYSLPWFGTQRVLRGGCWLTRSRLVHPRWRNFFTPGRGDVWAGFRTCAV